MADLDLNLEGMDKLMMKIDELTPAVKKDLGRTLLAMTLMVEADAKKRVKENFKGVGTLAASITHKILKVSGFPVSGQVGSKLAYAAIHEFGGTIEPKTAKWLTIPFEGVKGRARDYQDTFFRWKKGADGQQLILFQNVKGGDPIPLFVLVKRVEIPARPYLNPALKQNEQHITERMNEALRRSLKIVAGK